MLSGTAIVGISGAVYYYFTAMFGVKYSRIFGILHVIYYSAGN
jgi:heme/copper-type cytochrome/quinol oxidase subunit 1